MKALFVTKDTGGFKVAKPVADSMKKQGWNTTIIAEGKSFTFWEKAGYTPLFSKEISETLSLAKVTTILNKEKPAIIIVTLGSPINSENLFALKANKLKIPLVFIPDVWGAETRSRAVPDLVLAFDEFEASLCGERFLGTETEICIVGHPFIDELLQTGIPEKATSYVQEIKSECDGVILLAGQGAYTTDMLQILRLSLEMSDGKYVVIPRFHPKYKGTEYMETWKNELSHFPVKSIAKEASISTDHLAALCDITISTFSTLLMVSAYYNKVPISVNTPASIEAMVKSTGLDYYPPVLAEAAIEISEPVNIGKSLSKKSRALVNNQNRLFRKFDSEQALSVIKKLIQP